MNSYKPTFAQNVLQRIETRGVSLLIALILTVAGIAMCYSALEHEGVIHLKAAMVEGDIHTGSLGILALFLSVIIVLSCIWRPADPYTFEVQIDKRRLKWTGKMRSIDYTLFVHLQELVQQIHGDTQAPNRAQDCVISRAQAEQATGFDTVSLAEAKKAVKRCLRRFPVQVSA